VRLPNLPLAGSAAKRLTKVKRHRPGEHEKARSYLGRADHGREDARRNGTPRRLGKLLERQIALMQKRGRSAWKAMAAPRSRRQQSVNA